MNEQQPGLGLTLRFDQEKKALIASIEPAPQSAPIDEAWLQAKLAKMGWNALRYLPEAAAELLGSYNTGKPLTELRLAECVDARMEITIAPDELEATLDLVPAQGGETIGLEKVLAALRAKGVTNGIMLDAISQAVAAGEAQRMPIARGLAPLPGSDGYLECLLPMAQSRVPKVDEFDHADYRDLGEILAVAPGDALMLRHPPSAGVAGLSVLGKTIPTTNGKDVQYAASLSGAAPAPDKPDLLLASVGGQPVQVHDGMIVEPVFSVDSVGAASGNIDFNGSVLIKGDVQAGMTVRARGDIEVDGVVEAAILEAGGNIVIKGGTMGGLGHKEGAEHLLRCGGSFNAGYALQAKIEAGDSIYIDDTAIQCELSAVNNIRVGNSKRGHIIGGRAQATQSITAKVIGSPNRMATRFEIGVNPVLHKHLLEIIKSREAKETQLLEISKLLDFAHKNPARVPPEMLDRARNTAASLSASIAEIREDQNALEQKIERSKLARVVAEQAIHEGVEVLLCGHHFSVSGEHGAATLGMGEEGVGFLSEEDLSRTKNLNRAAHPNPLEH